MPTDKLKSITKIISGTLLVILIVLAIVVAIIPKALQFSAIYWLEEQGIEAQIKGINIELINGKFEIIGANGKNKNNQGFNIDRFMIDFKLLPLLENSVVINNIELTGFNLDITHRNQSIESIGGFLLPETNSEATTSEPTEENSTPSKPWEISLSNISLNSIKNCNQFKASVKQICVEIESFDWVGNIHFQTIPSIAEAMIVEGELKIQDVSITDAINKHMILTNSAISLSDFKIQGLNDVSLNHLQLDALKIFPDHKDPSLDIAILDKLEIDTLNFIDNKQLNIKSITAKGIGANILIEKDKKLNIQNKISSVNPLIAETPKEASAKTPNKSVEESNQQALSIKIDDIRIADSNPLNFNDQSLNSPFKITSIIKLIHLSNINSNDPTNASQLKVGLITGAHGKIDLNGDITLFNNLEDINISGKTTGIDLRPISSYLESSIGHRIKSGQLNSDIKLSVKKGTIDSLLDLDLMKFTLKAISEEEKKKLDEELGLGMPLDIALDMLRDGDDNISIKLPITGNMDAPEFDPSDAIYTAMSKAITVTIINYYTPFGLVAAAEGLFNLATALRFEPVIFDAGKSSISVAHKEKLGNIIKLLKQKPKLHLTLCGYSNINDLNTISPALYSELKNKPEVAISDEKVKLELLNLAAKRSELIKTYFIENKLAADRLILCEPEYIQDELSGVEISL